MAETKDQASQRLQKRSHQLQSDHAALEQAGRPFSEAEHQRLREDLHKHNEDLAAYRQMPDDSRPPTDEPTGDK